MNENERHSPRTVHLVVPATGRPLCGYEEESPTPAEGASAVACPECSALLRDGLIARRSMTQPRGRRSP
jgi:hypothetical protein